jgi:porin
MQHWYRAGYITNSTEYTSLRTGAKKSGNYCAYALADRQMWQPDKTQSGRGLYAGVSAMVVPADLDTYRLYYEVRAYSPAPFRSRSGDFASLVASYTAISQDKLRVLAAEGKTSSRASDSVTGSYTLRLARGTYAGLGLSYVNGPSVTPKTAAALTFTAQTSVFF